MASDVRQPINVERLSTFIDGNVPAIKSPIKLRQFGFGQSNPTYLLTASDGAQFVLRKKPPGKLLSKTAHQIEREFRIIHALASTDVPVPKAIQLCNDPDVIGTPFYIMEFLDGRIFEDPSFPGVSPSGRRAMWLDALRVLAKLHSVDPASVGLSDYGKSNGFYDRQIKTLANVSSAQARATDVDTKAAVGKIPHIDGILEFFRNVKTQARDRSALIHGDYKIDNVVFHKTEPKVIGVLDWEMSTIGHPLSDLSNLFSPYTFAAHPASAAELNLDHPGFAPTARLEGLPSRAECIACYAEAAGWGPTTSESKWGDAFGVFRNSVIVQGIAARLALRQASSAKAREHAVRLGPFGAFAWKLVEEAGAAAQAGGSKL